jgi:hypothetical protein
MRGTALAVLNAGMHDKTERKNKSLWQSALVTFSWVLLLVGLVLAAQAAVVIVKTTHLTTDTLSWSTAAFLALLIGSLLKSVAKGEKV